MNEHDRHSLSPEGRRRKEAMLDELLGHVDQRRSARTMRRRASWAVGVLVVGAFAARLVWITDPGSEQSRETIVQLPEPEPSETPAGTSRRVEVWSDFPRTIKIVSTGLAAHISRVESDPTIVGRMSWNDVRELVQRVDDRALLDTLAAINRPAGLIRIGHEVRLTRPVSDAELALLPSARDFSP